MSEESMTRAPTLYWVSLAYLVVANSVPGFLVYRSTPIYGDTIDMIAALLAIFGCFQAALALIFRRKIAVPLLIASLAVGIAGFLWSAQANLDHPQFAALRVLGFIILAAIIVYCRDLTRHGFLTPLFRS